MQSLSEFIASNSICLSKELRQRMNPLYDPQRDQPHHNIQSLLRTPKNPQQHIITGMARHLDRDNVGFFGMGMGTGKTYTALSTIHVRNHGSPYCCLVVCPPLLCRKWEREIKSTVPEAAVIHVRNWREWLVLIEILKTEEIVGPTFVVTPISTAKLGARWIPAASTHRRSGVLSCPQCFAELSITEYGEKIPMTWALLKKRKRYCHECNSALWQYSGYHCVEPSKLINKRLKKFFDYGIIDEQHLMKSQYTAAGEAFSHFVGGCRKVLILTGTLISGRSSDLRPTLFRCRARKMIEKGISYHDANKFDSMYGRIQISTLSRQGEKQKAWKNRIRKKRVVQPGITPEFYRDFMADCSVFLDLEEMAADDMPPLSEDMIDVGMSTEMLATYEMARTRIKDIYHELRSADEDAAMKWGYVAAEFLMTWPDCPSGWGSVKYLDENGQSKIAFTPKDFGDTPTSKEERLLEIIEEERTQNRQVWIYCNRTKVAERIFGIIRGRNIAVARLTRDTEPHEREEWIQQHGPGVDVVISHPVLVETGIDLFGKADGKYGMEYNFCTLIHY